MQDIMNGISKQRLSADGSVLQDDADGNQAKRDDRNCGKTRNFD
jgi:hypothetical protein